LDGLAATDNQSGSADGATCGSAIADSHTFGGFGVSLPFGSTVEGIEVSVSARADSANNSPQMCVQLSWDGGLSWSSPTALTPILSNSFAAYTLGSSTDTWGHAWLLGELQDSLLLLRVTDVAAKKDRDFYLDDLAVQVWYTPP
jgi:hypothetical protein